jgi:hypothetical protein
MEVNKIDEKLSVKSSAKFGEVCQVVADKIGVDILSLNLVSCLDFAKAGTNFSTFSSQEDWLELLIEARSYRVAQRKKKTGGNVDGWSVQLKMKNAANLTMAFTKVSKIWL